MMPFRALIQKITQNKRKMREVVKGDDINKWWLEIVGFVFHFAGCLF